MSATRNPRWGDLRRALALALLAVAGLLLLAAGVAAARVLARPRIQPVPSTTHPSIGRSQCLECHAPIATEWRESFHHRSVTGPHWEEVRQLGYASVFDALRKPCLHCHAPANVLDLSDPSASLPAGERDLGVECTPNLLRDPSGGTPALRSDDVALGVDCVACHVSERGIVGPGRRPTPDHETLADDRFLDAARTTASLCRTCHASLVAAWARTRQATEGVTCLDCHMPRVVAPSVAGGPERSRRSHRFLADKDDAMLRQAVHATLEMAPERKARFVIVNDRVGHHLPSGGNWLSVHLKASDASGRVRSEHEQGFGREEALLLDFWPFKPGDTRIAPGERREILFALPPGHGTVEAVVRYHDWMRTRRTVVTLTERY